jgi:hypothetical protein
MSSSSSSLPPDKISSLYRFSGYLPPLTQLDGVGPAYYVVGIHPYYINQPTFWKKPIYIFSPMVSFGSLSSIPSSQTFGTSLKNEKSIKVDNNPRIAKTSKLFKMKPMQ